jgi:hyperosmotically inducible protein
MKTLIALLLLAAAPLMCQNTNPESSQNSASQGSTMPNSASPQTPSMPSGSSDQTGGALSERGIDRIVREAHHELVMLPYYGVFDDLKYQVAPDGTVTLMGEVTNPVLKSDAENAVKRIEGVPKVINNIKVLPTSFNDDRIRRAVYHAIYGNEVLSQYALRAVPPIHIIVENGHVTLEGVVARPMDKQVAEIQAKSVPGVFSVTNNLKVENSESK